MAQFRAKYYPDSFRDKLNDALNHIQQGDKTVDEYERDFSNIVRFVPSVASDEREKARKFFTGLNARYREVMGKILLPLISQQLRRLEVWRLSYSLQCSSRVVMEVRVTRGVNIRGFTRREESLRRNTL